MQCLIFPDFQVKLETAPTKPRCKANRVEETFRARLWKNQFFFLLPVQMDLEEAPEHHGRAVATLGQLSGKNLRSASLADFHCEMNEKKFSLSLSR